LREAASIYSQAKNQVFRHAGGLVAPIYVKLGMANGHVGPIGCANFHLNRCRGWESGPKNIKNFQLVIKGSPPVVKPLDQFLKVLEDFMRTIILQKCFKFNSIRFTDYGVIAEKPRVGHLGQIFPCTL